MEDSPPLSTLRFGQSQQRAGPPVVPLLYRVLSPREINHCHKTCLGETLYLLFRFLSALAAAERDVSGEEGYGQDGECSWGSLDASAGWMNSLLSLLARCSSLSEGLQGL